MREAALLAAWSCSSLNPRRARSSPALSSRLISVFIKNACVDTIPTLTTYNTNRKALAHCIEKKKTTK